tara:strand:+ start:53 stop:286 length:234 start_codon:yes stop_codon:yes gene_type:complete
MSLSASVPLRVTETITTEGKYTYSNGSKEKFHFLLKKIWQFKIFFVYLMYQKKTKGYNRIKKKIKKVTKIFDIVNYY